MLTLYYAAETCSLASHIALEEAGADYSLVRISFARDEQHSPDFLAINPKGRVPALVTARGILTETPAILVFIAQTFPKARLAPLENAFAFAEVLWLLVSQWRHRFGAKGSKANPAVPTANSIRLA